jgi:hypothetical protein
MRTSIFIALGFIALGIGGCGNGSSGNGLDSPTQYLASNIVFRSASAALKTQVDTETQVLAENVILDNGALGVDAQDVQSAFEQTEPNIAETIIGSWSITLIGSGENASFTSDIGTISFNADGTYILDSTYNGGPFREIFIRALAGYAHTTLTYQVVDNMIISLRAQGSDDIPEAVPTNYVNPLVIFKATLDKINLGCLTNNIGGIAILTRL